MPRRVRVDGQAYEVAPDITSSLRYIGGQVFSGPHEFRRRGWRWWLCAHCYAPRVLHPRYSWARSRPEGDHRTLPADAPHFTEGW